MYVYKYVSYISQQGFIMRKKQIVTVIALFGSLMFLYIIFTDRRLTFNYPPISRFKYNNHTWREYYLRHKAAFSINKQTKVKSEHPSLRKPCPSCPRNDYKFIHNNDQICENTYNKVDILILITTTHGNKDKRNAIRNSWLVPSRNNTSNVRYVFLLGGQKNDDVNIEFEQYQDIIQANFDDAYKNLTLKTIMGFKWAISFCSTAKFVMKTDDDMYVNVAQLLKILPLYNTKLQRSVGGRCKSVAYPQRSPLSKWYVPREMYPQNEYPGFCSGTGYVTSMSVVSKILDMSKSVPFFYLEDIYVSLCIKRLGYSLIPMEGFNANRVPINPCLYKSNKVITSHGISPEELLTVSKKICT